MTYLKRRKRTAAEEVDRGLVVVLVLVHIMTELLNWKRSRNTKQQSAGRSEKEEERTRSGGRVGGSGGRAGRSGGRGREWSRDK